jgi:hypothetical protein
LFGIFAAEFRLIVAGQYLCHVILTDLNRLRVWVESNPEVPVGNWCKSFRIRPTEESTTTSMVGKVGYDARGQFTFSNVAPGDYKVFVWEALEANAFLNPEVLKQEDAKAKPIHVLEGAPQTIEMRAIPVPAPF